MTRATRASSARRILSDDRETNSSVLGVPAGDVGLCQREYGGLLPMKESCYSYGRALGLSNARCRRLESLRPCSAHGWTVRPALQHNLPPLARNEVYVSV